MKKRHDCRLGRERCVQGGAAEERGGWGSREGSLSGTAIERERSCSHRGEMRR